MIRTHRNSKLCLLGGFVISMLLMPLFASAEVGADLQLSDETDVLTVSGTVLDATGFPLIGASILEQGTLNGTITDIAPLA